MGQTEYIKHPAFTTFMVNDKIAKDFMHEKIYTWVKDFSEPEMQNAKVSKDAARKMVSLWYNSVGLSAPDFDKDIKKEPIKTNLLLRQEITDEVIALSLYYLEHGNITDKQRKYLHKILAKSSPKDSWKKVFIFDLYILLSCIMFIVLYTIYPKLGITPEQMQNIFLSWLGGSLAVDIWSLFSMVVPPTYYTHKFNKTLKER